MTHHVTPCHTLSTHPLNPFNPPSLTLSTPTYPGGGCGKVPRTTAAATPAHGQHPEIEERVTLRGRSFLNSSTNHYPSNTYVFSFEGFSFAYLPFSFSHIYPSPSYLCFVTSLTHISPLYIHSFIHSIYRCISFAVKQTKSLKWLLLQR